MAEKNLALKPIATPEVLKDQFDKDTQQVAEQTVSFLETMHPAYLYTSSKEEICNLSYDKSDMILDAFTFYRLASCKTEDVEDLYAYLNEKMTRFFSAIYSLERPVVYGLVSYSGHTNLVIGLQSDSNEALTVKSVMEGLLDGIELQPYKPNFSNRENHEKNVGLISAIPSTKINGEKQKFDLSSLMKSLNGQNYIVLFVARPLPQEVTLDKYGKLIGIRDACFAVSKRNISRQQGMTHTEGETRGTTITDTHTEGITNTTGQSFTFSKAVTMGASIGLSLFGIGGGLFCALSKSIGATFSHSKSKHTSDSHAVSESYSKSISDAINQTEGISHEIQNGFALEMIEYANKAIERLRQGRSNGMWETMISYSADTEIVAGIIRACITGEMAKPNPDILPLVSRNYQLSKKEAEENSLILPKIMSREDELSPLCTALTSDELGMMCSIPIEAVPDFELKKGKVYPLVSDRIDGVMLGFLTEGNRKLEHMPFVLSNKDLARHTFICGITGSGKTTTVKKILNDAGVPFLVIESAKKEYRNIKLADGKHPQIYTLGKPEINCLRFNPFYIQCGISPQIHIDFLKDLFNASFSFYGPMPYILEKCLHSIYQRKGWNLTLGFHPYLVNKDNSAKLFDAEYMQKQYRQKAHKFLFPTMQDLKNEIKRYIEEEMQYEGEVAGNIKTAILARLESLCSGAKGYMFNTNEYADMETLLNEKTVFELEGLADDADKAFCVGLLVILVNEYRQITKEIENKNKELSHLLVIEEAHRLLKNINTERTSEELGNPKGKAVEHFTNMIAEMRSYGQGVIIAEQIPTKLTPDVIKNSSNKIIQRLVAADDQNLVANTVGLSHKDAIYIGNLTTGSALCHKESMSLPVNVTIIPVEENFVSDDALYNHNIEGRLHNINVNIVRECIANHIDLLGLQMLNSILIQEYDYVKNSIAIFRKKCRNYLTKQNKQLILCENENAIYAELISENIVKYLLNGVYSTKHLISDSFIDLLLNFLQNSDPLDLEKIKKELWDIYKDDPAYKGKHIITQMLLNQMDSDTAIEESIKSYFIFSDSKSVEDIKREVVK